MEDVFNLFKISDVRWIGVLGPQIKAFADKIDIPTITYETLYTYFVRTVQTPNEFSQFWVVGGKNLGVVAFAHWYVCDLPHRGLVFCDYIYSWNRMRKPVQMLLDQFIEFGKENNCPLYKGTAVNETVFRVFRKAASKRGFNLNRTSLVDFIGERKK